MSVEYQILKDTVIYYQRAYDEGHPRISDAQYDDLYFQLKQMEEEQGYADPDSPTQRVIFTVVDKLEKVEHNHPMLSLDKTKDYTVIKDFMAGHDCIAMAKMDGLTMSLTYQDGELVRAETRGNGIVGEDVTHNARVIGNIPKTISEKGTVVVDGEVICTYIDFDEFAAEYSNPRNFAAGSIRLLDSKVCAPRALRFIAWDRITVLWDQYLPGEPTLNEKLRKLYLMGFEVVPYLVSDKIELSLENMQFIQEICQEKGYPIDGLVFKYNDCEEYLQAGTTAHHFRGGMAYKFYDETYDTELVDIDWSLGRTGIITPVAVFKEIEIDGAKINRASLHNLSVMKELLGTPYKGQKLKIFRANQIIPQIYEAEQATEKEGLDFFKYPEICPACGEPLSIHTTGDVSTLHCENKQCSGQLLWRIDHFCSKKGLDIKGLSEATIEKLIDWNWITCYDDLFRLERYRNDWIGMSGFGDKSVEKILKTIKQITEKPVKLANFISAIGIPLIGMNYAKELAKHFSNWQEFREAVDGNYAFNSFSGFGAEMQSAIINFDYTEADQVAKRFKIESECQSPVLGSLSGLTFVVTGKLKLGTREGFRILVESKGGRLTDSVSSKTSYLVNNDINSNTGKNKAAKALGVPIISEVEFLDLLNKE